MMGGMENKKNGGRGVSWERSHISVPKQSVVQEQTVFSFSSFSLSPFSSSSSFLTSSSFFSSLSFHISMRMSNSTKLFGDKLLRCSHFSLNFLENLKGKHCQLGKGDHSTTCMRKFKPCQDVLIL